MDVLTVNKQFSRVNLELHNRAKPNLLHNKDARAKLWRPNRL